MSLSHHYHLEKLTDIHSKLLSRDTVVDILLPFQYEKGSKHYPLLILNDGQDGEAIHLKATMEKLTHNKAIKDVIVVAVHAGDRRSLLVVDGIGMFPLGAEDAVAFYRLVDVASEQRLRIDLALAELSRVSRGVVVVTTPSFGDDHNGGVGLPVGDEWRADADAGRRFGRIVLDDEGRPHHGHLTLATYGWWTERFLAHGLVRDADAERAMLTHPRYGVARWRWNLYVLLSSPEG